ncbi:MAG: four helix bundle suffix domain-containing protein [Parcubacteria group bacterium]|jgi:four helix bundle suffix protein
MSEPAYKNLLTYKYAVLIYDMNKEFIARFVSGAENMRQRQQMDQAARSSKQCIVEGAMQGTSLKGYIKMLGVSRGSWEELLEDYKDIARLGRIEIWNSEGLRRERRFRIFVKDGEPLPPAPPLPPDLSLAVNIMIDLITRTNFLLDQQKRSLEEKFLKEGGYTENLYKKRRESRGF